MSHYTRLNVGWNAEPNAPEAKVSVDGDAVRLTFALNAFEFPVFTDGQRAMLTFSRCTRYRLGAPNDEGWYRGQHGFRNAPPPWGEFYELGAVARIDPGDWRAGPAGPGGGGTRHFLFYLRDATFECVAADWSLEVQALPTLGRAV